MKISKINVFLSVIVLTICISFCCAFVKIIAKNKDEDCLIGKVIFIDPGHGGKDNGASVDGVLEDTINLKISKLLFEYLIDSGAYVLTSRTNDYDLASTYQKNRKREDLNKRVRYINSSKPDLFVSIHLNAFNSSVVSGAQVFHQTNDNSIKLANYIQKELNVLTQKEKKIKRGDYFVLNKTDCTGVLVECGFLSNVEERKKLNDVDYLKKLAKKIKKGITQYFVNCEQ